MNAHDHPLYSTWANMKNRCYNPNAVRYADYGGRGIKVYKRWHVFKNFAEDIGQKPPGRVTLDRIDNSKGYYPWNVRWATVAEQNRNSRRCVMVTFQGKTQTINEWCREVGLAYVTYKQRMRKGWDRVAAATTPPNTRYKRKSTK